MGLALFLTQRYNSPATRLSSPLLHVSRHLYVKPLVSLPRWLIAVLAVSALAADERLDNTLKAVENHYNHAKTLRVLFTEQYTPAGKLQRTESGTLMLRKPGRMRGEYANPKGKIFVSDGTYLYLYSPSDNRAQKMKLKDSLAEDMRVPLAFLLGKLNFNKEFTNLHSTPDPAGVRITAEPKNDNLPYSQVEFLVTPENQIKALKITSADRSVLAFSFSEEKMDPPLDAKLFNFQLPAGAQWDEASQ